MVEIIKIEVLKKINLNKKKNQKTKNKDKYFSNVVSKFTFINMIG